MLKLEGLGGLWGLGCGLDGDGRFAGSEVFEDEVDAGDEEEGDDGGEEDAEGEGDGHGDEEFGLHVGFEDHGHDADEGGEGGEEDGAEAGTACHDCGGADGSGFLAVAVDVVDHDEGVVHDDAGEGDDAAHGHDA